MNGIDEESIRNFEENLRSEEKAESTIQKYGAILRTFARWLAGKELTRERLLAYREELLQSKKAQTVNGALSALHSFLDFAGMREMKVKYVKVQRQVFLTEERELTQAEYRRLLAAAQEKGDERLYLVMLTLGSTGIRIGELPFITYEACREGRAQIRLKGKIRTILLPAKLRKKLLDYAKRKKIREGVIFRTRSGRPMSRSNIHHSMKALSSAAKVDPRKVFPHNFRHLFARAFYAVEKNLAYLADVLGHSSIETTRIYVAAPAKTHERILNRMKLIL